MPEEIDLIVGTDRLLAIHLAAQLLARSKRDVWWLDGPALPRREVDRSFLVRILERLVPASRVSDLIENHFHMLRLPEWEQTARDLCVRAVDAWVLSSAFYPLPGVNGADIEYDKRLISVGRNAGSLNLNYVVRPAMLPVSLLDELPGTGFDGACRAFCVEGLVNADLDDYDFLDDDLSRIVGPIRDVICEIRDRCSEYFDWDALRVGVEAQSLVELTPVDEAVRLMLEQAGSGRSARQICSIDASLGVTADYLCACLTRMNGVEIAASGPTQPLNAVDRLLAERLQEAGSIWAARPHSATAVHATVRLESKSRLAWPVIERMLEQANNIHDLCCRKREDRIAALRQTLHVKTIPVDRGELTYYRAGGGGTPLVFLNALGQGLECWLRLIDQLEGTHRVYVWEARSISTTPAETVTLDDHVADLEVVIQSEGLTSCVLIGWCTGPQIAVEYYYRHPESVRAMVFLNCTFTIPGYPEFEAYEKYFRKLCEAIVTRPQFAASAMKSLSSVPELKRSDLMAVDAETRASTIARLPARSLRRELVKPFETVETTRRYAAQSLDYRAHDSLANAHAVQASVLMISAEYDSVIPPPRVEAIAACFPRRSHWSIAGGTHYALHERCETVARHIQAFLSECD